MHIKVEDFPWLGIILVCFGKRIEIEQLGWVMSRVLQSVRHWLGETKGAVMVEFAVLCTVFLLIVAGIMDLGHAFYMDQVITNASREGARYGVVYQTYYDGTRKAPSSFSPTIENHLLATTEWNLKAYLPTDADPHVYVTGDGSTTSGDKLEVKVTAKKTWFVLDNFIPSLGDSKTLSSTTVMRLE
jgi:Flp pilus assembly protein TadG